MTRHPVLHRIRRAVVALVPCVVLLGVTGLVEAGDLDPQQVKTLATLASYAKQIETNVRIATDGVGAGEGKPSDAKIRLARTRLEQPKGMLVSVREALAKLPENQADVTALRARLDASAAAITALEARLDGTSAGTTGAPTPAAPGVRLDYKQQKSLSDGEFHARRVANAAADLVELRKVVDATADKDAIDHRLVRAGMGTIEAARRSAVHAKSHLDPLPGNGAGVAEIVSLLATALTSIAASEAALTPIHARLSHLVDPAAYPALSDDVRRLRDLASMYRETDVFARDPRRAAVLVGEGPAARTAYAAIAKAYAPFLAQKTEEGKPVDAALRHFHETLAAFDAATDRARTSLPAEIDAEVASVDKLVATAVTESKPAFFVHAIPERVKALDGLVELQSALDAEAGKRAAATVAALRTALATKRDSLRDAIIDANELPPDRYTGPDRAELEKASVAAWKALEGDAEVLAVRIPSEAWRRETLWRRQNSTWYLIDRSSIQVQLLVKRDDRLAIIRPIDLWIDHQAGDVRKAFPFHAAKDAIEPQFFVRRDKIK